MHKEMLVDVKLKIKDAEDFIMQGDFSGATGIYQDLLKSQPDNAFLYNKLGQAKAQSQEWLEAINSYQKALKLGINNPFWTYKNLGDALKEINRLDEAISNYQKAISIQSDNPEVCDSLGQVKSLKGSFQEAITSYQKALELKIDNPFWTYKNLADALLKENRLNEAKSAYQEALKLQPNNSLVIKELKEIEQQPQNEATDDTWLEIHNQGDEYFKQEKWEDAIASYQKAIELNPDSFWSYYNLGKSLAQLARWDHALKSYEKAISLNSGIAEIYISLGNVLIKQEKWEEVTISYLQAINLDPNQSKWIYRDTIDILTNLENIEQANRLAKKAINLYPDSDEILDVVNKLKGKTQKYYKQNILEDKAIQEQNICLATFSLNQDRYLNQCVNSILGQGYTNLDYIIIDGGSSDNSLEIIQQTSNVLKSWKTNPGQSKYASLNEALNLNEIQSDIMGWINADDIMLPGSLYLINQIFQDLPDVDWIASQDLLLLNDEGIIVSRQFNNTEIDKSNKFDYVSNDKADFIIPNCTFWRRSLWEKAGKYIDPNLQLAADIDLWCRFLSHTNLVLINAPITAQRAKENYEIQDIQYEELYKQEISAIRDKYNIIPFSFVGDLLEGNNVFNKQLSNQLTQKLKKQLFSSKSLNTYFDFQQRKFKVYAK